MIKNQNGIYSEEDYIFHNYSGYRMAFVHLQLAGALKLEVETLIVSECYFANNSNLKGGAIYINKNENYEMQYILIEKTIFTNNEAGDNGGCIEMEKKLRQISGNITNNYFLGNLAWSNIFFPYKKIFF